ncbi:MAG: response regulator [Chitinophagales bacterium]|jgi:DNA-binding response OmpR family regulator|nr:response regulator [Bacteroidota bacterium]MBK7568247.1 response regulator [Bacteroidota bacterium]MBP8917784.1 response regulator [Chitinophagales bacterium]MBP9220655.1 response regulator [Chitinophagales bacterium]
MDLKKNINVLLIEDNPADARLVEIYLNESTMLTPNISKVVELKKGMLMLEESDFDIVLLDLTLPDSSGFDTVKTLLNEFPTQTVIVMTGLEDDTVAINSVKAGAQDFIVKGQFDNNLLSRTVSYAIERHQLQIKLENYAKAIKLNEQRLIEAQTMARMGNWELDVVNNQMYWSNEVFRILGFKENTFEPTLNDYLKYIAPEEVTEVHNAIKRTMEKGKPYHTEYKIILPGNVIKQIANRGQIQKSKKNNGLCLSGTIQDISNLTNKSDEKNPIIEELTKHYSEILAEAEKLNGCDDLKNMIKSGNDIVNKLRM